MVVQSYSTAKSKARVRDSTTGSSTTVNHDNDHNDPTIILCSSCVNASLQLVRERHQLAKETWYESRTKCTEYFQQIRLPDQEDVGTTSTITCSNEATIQIYEQRYQQLRKELEMLQQDCSKVTMETCALNLRIIERQESLATRQDQYAAQRRQILSQLQQSLCGNNCQSNITTINANDMNQEIMEDHTDTLHSTDISHVRPIHSGVFLRSIEIAQGTVRTLRFHWALQTFAMFRIQIDEEDMFRSVKNKEKGDDTAENNQETRGTRRLRTGTSRDSNKVVVSGIGKICGLPLPHAGMELYGVLPYEELQSALRLVAQLTHVMARCFNIRLPHPIVITPPPPTQQQQPPSSRLFSSPRINHQDGDIADLAHHSNHIPVKRLDGTYVSAPTATGIHSITASLTSLSSILSGGGIVESRSVTSGPSPRFQQQNQPSPLMLLSMDPKHVEERIRHATSAIIAEDQSRTTFYTLSTITLMTDTTNNEDIQQLHTTTSNIASRNNKFSYVADTGPTAQPQQKINDEFAIALQLLQNDILMICMNVGVPIDQLYPGEALLLNLFALQLFCSENV